MRSKEPATTFLKEIKRFTKEPKFAESRVSSKTGDLIVTPADQNTREALEKAIRQGILKLRKVEPLLPRVTIYGIMASLAGDDIAEAI